MDDHPTAMPGFKSGGKGTQLGEVDTRVASLGMTPGIFRKTAPLMLKGLFGTRNAGTEDSSPTPLESSVCFLVLLATKPKTAPARPSYRPPRPFTRRVLSFCCGAGPRTFPALSTACARGCWAGATFSGLTFS